MQRIHQLKAFLEQGPTDSFIKFALALEYLKINDTAQALGYFLSIRQHDPKYTGLYYHLGKLYEKLGDREAAISTYTEGIDLTKTTDPHACNELRQALDEIMNYE